MHTGLHSVALWWACRGRFIYLSARVDGPSLILSPERTLRHVLTDAQEVPEQRSPIICQLAQRTRYRVLLVGRVSGPRSLSRLACWIESGSTETHNVRSRPCASDQSGSNVIHSEALNGCIVRDLRPS